MKWANRKAECGAYKVPCPSIWSVRWWYPLPHGILAVTGRPVAAVSLSEHCWPRKRWTMGLPNTCHMCNLSILAGWGGRIDIKAILSKEIKKHISLTPGLVGVGGRSRWIFKASVVYMASLQTTRVIWASAAHRGTGVAISHLTAVNPMESLRLTWKNYPCALPATQLSVLWLLGLIEPLF